MGSGKKKSGADGIDEKLASRKQLIQRIDTLVALSEHFEARSSSLFKDLQKLAGAHSGLAESTGTLTRRIDELAERNTRLELKLAALPSSSDEMTGLKSQLVDLERAVERAERAAQDQIARLQDKLDAVPTVSPVGDTLIDRMDEQAKAGSEAIASVNNRLQALDDALSQSRIATDQLASRLDTLDTGSNSLADIDRTLTDNRSELQRLTERLARIESVAEQDTALLDIESGLSGLGERLGALESNFTDVEHNRDDGRQLLNAANEGLAQLDSKTRALAEQMATMETALADTSAMAAKIAELDAAQTAGKTELDTLGGRLESLGEAVHGATELMGQEAERLSVLSQQVEGETEQSQKTAGEQERQRIDVQKLAGRVERLETHQAGNTEEGKAAGRALDERMSLLEQGQVDLGQSSEIVNAALENAISGLERVREQNSALTDTVNGLNRIGDRVQNLETRNDEFDQKQRGYEETTRELRALVEGLERTAADHAERMESEARRIAGQDEFQQGERDRLNILGGEIEQYGIDLSSAVSRIEALQQADGELSDELKKIAASLEALAEQDQRLEKVLTAAQDKLRYLAAQQDAAGHQVDAVRKNSRGQDERITRLGSGMRMLAWAGAVAAGLLLILAVAALWLPASEPAEDDEVIVRKLELMEQRLASSESSSPKVKGLTTEMTNLRQEVRLLHSRLDDVPIGEDGYIDRMIEDYEQHKNSAIQALDEVNERLAQLETEPKISAPAKSPSRPKPAPKSKPAKSTTSPVPPDWRTGQRQGAFTVQLVGVSSEASLRRFVRKHGINGRSAYLETTYQGKPWYVLFHGVYKTRRDAARASRELARSVSGKPWVRQLPSTGEVRRLR